MIHLVVPAQVVSSESVFLIAVEEIIFLSVHQILSGSAVLPRLRISPVSILSTFSN